MKTSPSRVGLMSAGLLLTLAVFAFTLSRSNPPTPAKGSQPGSLPSMTPVPTESEPSEKPERPSSRVTPVPTLKPGDPWARRAYGTRMTDINYLTDRATTIVRGTVTGIGEAKWTTPDGERPVNPHSDNNTYGIFTPVSVRVQTYIKGTQPGSELLLMAAGGTIGQDSAVWASDNLFNFQVGEEVIVFLRGPEVLHGSEIWTIIEHYTITSDDSATNLHLTIPVSQLLDEIKAAQGVEKK